MYQLALCEVINVDSVLPSFLLFGPHMLPKFNATNFPSDSSLIITTIKDIIASFNA